MAHKLNAKQAEALELIENNPRKVLAWDRSHKGMLRIHGNTENKLFSLGFIQAVKVGAKVVDGRTWPVKAWKLTEAGAEALGRTEDRAIEAMRDAARIEGERMGLSLEQIERFLSRMG